jgi:hypothetical protein
VNFGDARAHSATLLPGADYVVSADITLNASGWGNKAGVRGRDAGGLLANAYEAYYSEATGQWRLDKWAGFSSTNLGAFAQPFGVGQTHSIALAMQGSTITVRINGVARITVTDTSIPSANFAGIYLSGGLHDGMVLDNYSVSASGTTGPPAEPVTLTVSGLPQGATPGVAPGGCTPTCSATLTISTLGSTPPGIYPVTISGTSMSATHQATVNLTVGP